MDSGLKEINNILMLCDLMIQEIRAKGILKTGNQTYEQYKTIIYSFLKSKNLAGKEYGPYAALNSLWFSSGNYTVNLSEAETIRKIVIEIKHELFPESFERIFISHREKDKEQIDAFVELLHAIGMPRPTINNDNKVIFCTSHPAAYIDNGKRNLDEIRCQFNGADHVFFILWYSDNYFESQACLNEAGAIWALNKKYQEILVPGFDFKKIGGLMDKQSVWFRADDRFRLNTFKTQLESMFGLDPIAQNAWEKVRDDFIRKISTLTNI